jgi:hypothetical protein
MNVFSRLSSTDENATRDPLISFFGSSLSVDRHRSKALGRVRAE